MISIADNSERARRVVLFFWVLLGSYILLIFFSAVMLGLGVEVQATEDDVVSSLVALGLILAYVLMVAVYIAVIIVYIQWFRRAYHNLKRAGHAIEMSEGWAAGAWFFPFANFFVPYRIMKEIWYKTQWEYTKETEDHSLVRTWWLVFIVGNIISQILSRFFDDEQLSELALFTIISSGIHICGIVPAVQVVKRIAGFEELFAQHLRIITIGQQPMLIEETDTEEEFY